MMQKRYMLRRHIVSAWHRTVKNAYSEGLINSERSLQHYFCENLLAEFKNDDVRRAIFVEPCFSCPDQRRSPDVIVCHTKEIIGAIELKFSPRGKPSGENVKKDLGTLHWLASPGNALTLKNERYLGPPRPVREYTIADDAILCWAGIYKGPRLQIESKQDIQPRFLTLHALTSAGELPEVLPELRD